MDFYKRTIPILDMDQPATALSHPKWCRLGAVPRDYAESPESMFSSPTEMKLVPESEYDARYDEQEELCSSLEHIYLSGPNKTPRFVNLDQNGQGYCWMYSTGTAMMLDRLKQNLPMVRFNPHGPACIIKKGRDEGGWCGLGAEFARDVGMPSEGTGPGQWPKHGMSLRYDTPELRTAMALHRVTEDWVDLTRQVYSRQLTQQMLFTCGFNNIPCPSDFNWWAHSVCQVRKVRIERGSWGTLILNSWLNWGHYGLAVLRGSQAIANSAVAYRATTASAA